MRPSPDRGSGAVSFPRLVVPSVIILELFLQPIRSCGQLCSAMERPFPRGPRQGSRFTSSTLNSADRLPRATRGRYPSPVPWVDCRCHCSGERALQHQKCDPFGSLCFLSVPTHPLARSLRRPLLGKWVFLHDGSNGTRSAQMGRRVVRDESFVVVACVVCRALPEFLQMWVGPPWECQEFGGAAEQRAELLVPRTVKARGLLDATGRCDDAQRLSRCFARAPVGSRQFTRALSRSWWAPPLDEHVGDVYSAR